MGTEVLRPHEFLSERFREPLYSKKAAYGSFSYTSTCSSYVQSSRPGGRKLSAGHKKREGSAVSKKVNLKNEGVKKSKDVSTPLVMEKVVILRRGESLDSKIKSLENSVTKISMKNELGIVDLRSPMAMGLDIFAGSACAVSPEPSSLPLPSFSKKKHVFFDDSASKDLRRLLRLEF